MLWKNLNNSLEFSSDNFLTDNQKIYDFSLKFL